MDADDVWGNAWNESPPKEQTGSTPSAQVSLTPNWTVDKDENQEADVGLSPGIDSSWSPPVSSTFRSSALSEGWGASAVPNWGPSSSTIGGWVTSEESRRNSDLGLGEGGDEEVDIGDSVRPPLPPEIALPQDTTSTGSVLSQDNPAVPENPLETSTEGFSVSPPFENSLTTANSEEVVHDSVYAPKYLSPTSPEGFGTFESALTPDNNAMWSPHATSFEVGIDGGDAGWGSAWSGGQTESPTGGHTEKQWHASSPSGHRSRKDVPTYLIDNILAEWQMFAREVLTEHSSESESPTNDESDWQGGIESVEGLNSLMNTFLPDLSIPPHVPFSNTKIAANITAGLKSTRDLSITRASPLSHLYASKGSTSWITSVKNRTDPEVDEWAWMGGKPPDLSQEVSNSSVAPTEKKGGLLSFFGRRSTQVPELARSPEPNKTSVTPSSSRPATPKIASPLTSSFPGTLASNSRTSDGRKSDVSKPSSPTIPTPPPIVMPFVPFESGTSPASEATGSSQASPAPSAVSRFFGRFSRSKSGSSNPHQLALSTSDLAFLDEIPSMMDGDDELDELSALEGMLASKPSLPSKPIVPTKLPMPLAPPPPPAKRSPVVLSPSPSVSSSNNNTKDQDMWGIFEKPIQASLIGKPPSALGIPSKPGVLHGSSRSSTPMLPPTLAPPPSRPATIAGPPSRSSTPVLSPPSASSTHSQLTATPYPISRPGSSLGILPPPRPSSSTPSFSQPPQPRHHINASLDDFDDFITAPGGSSATGLPPTQQSFPVISAPSATFTSTSRTQASDMDAAFGDFGGFGPSQTEPPAASMTTADVYSLSKPHAVLPQRSPSPLPSKLPTKTGIWPISNGQLPQLLPPPPQMGIGSVQLNPPGQGIPAPLSTESGRSGNPFSDGMSMFESGPSFQPPQATPPIPAAVKGILPDVQSGLKSMGVTNTSIRAFPGPPGATRTMTPELPIPPKLSVSAFSIPTNPPVPIPTATSQSVLIPKGTAQPLALPSYHDKSGGKSNKLSASDLSFFEGL